jgi:hypothetical protein
MEQLLIELGPLLVNDNGTALEFNKISWNSGLLASLLVFSPHIHKPD